MDFFFFTKREEVEQLVEKTEDWKPVIKNPERMIRDLNDRNIFNGFIHYSLADSLTDEDLEIIKPEDAVILPQLSYKRTLKKIYSKVLISGFSAFCSKLEDGFPIKYDIYKKEDIIIAPLLMVFQHSNLRNSIGVVYLVKERKKVDDPADIIVYRNGEVVNNNGVRIDTRVVILDKVTTMDIISTRNFDRILKFRVPFSSDEEDFVFPRDTSQYVEAVRDYILDLDEPVGVKFYVDNTYQFTERVFVLTGRRGRACYVKADTIWNRKFHLIFRDCTGVEVLRDLKGKNFVVA